jgi:hypothetical protein
MPQPTAQQSGLTNNPYQGQEEIGHALGGMPNLIAGGVSNLITGGGGGSGSGSGASSLASLIPLIASMADKGASATIPYTQRIKGILDGTKGLNQVIPPGYPDDTMPIMVSSGEKVKVTPANKVSAEEKAKAKPDLKAAIAKIKRKTPQSGPVTQKDVNASAAMKSPDMVDLILALAKRVK